MMCVGVSVGCGHFDFYNTHTYIDTRSLQYNFPAHKSTDRERWVTRSFLDDLKEVTSVTKICKLIANARYMS